MTSETMTAVQEQRVTALLRDSLVFDGLGSAARGAVDHVLANGINAVNTTIAGSIGNTGAALARFRDLYSLVLALPKKALLVRTVEDIKRAKREGKLGFVAGTQNGAIIENDLGWLSTFWGLGLRIFELTYSEANQLGYGCLEPEDRGLMYLGIEAVRECNRLGIVVDVSHVGHNTARDAVKYSEQPIIASHSNCHSLTPVPRNLPDDVVKPLAEKGGVIGIMAYGRMCEAREGLRPTVEDYLNHIDYAVKKLGVDHVGIGTDMVLPPTDPAGVLKWNLFGTVRYPELWGPYNHAGAQMVEGMDTYDGFTNIVRGLVKRGYSDEAIGKILGGNFMRVFEQVWKTI